jgi:hypothetical protein
MFVNDILILIKLIVYKISIGYSTSGGLLPFFLFLPILGKDYFALTTIDMAQMIYYL